MSILTASRAILFKDGIRGKSHICITRYIEAAYGKRLGSDTIKLLDSFREERHEVQYSAGFRASELQAKEIVEFAEEFLGKAEDIVKI